MDRHSIEPQFAPVQAEGTASRERTREAISDAKAKTLLLETEGIARYLSVVDFHLSEGRTLSLVGGTTDEPTWILEA